MSDVRTVPYEPARRADLFRLMEEVWGDRPSDEVFDWWFERNPTGPRLVTLAEDGDAVTGTGAMSFYRMVIDGEEQLIAISLGMATHPQRRGKGVFERVQRVNEQVAAAAGARLALGFANATSGPIYVGKLGWIDVCRPRIWVRPKRVRPKREGRLRVAPTDARFGASHEHAYRLEAPSWGNHIVRNAAYLNWRYADSPREYARLDGAGGWAVVGHALWHGLSTAVVCDAVGAGKARLLRRCVAAVDADVAVALPNPGEYPAYLGAGFVPSPRSVRLIGMPLVEGASLPRERSAWRFSLGDLDIF